MNRQSLGVMQNDSNAAERTYSISRRLRLPSPGESGAAMPSAGSLPGSEFSTPAHYDLVYLRGGTDRLVTVWIPVGDCPVEMGGLVYLENSHRLGVKMEAEFAARSADLPPEERIRAYNRHMTEGGWISKDLPDMARKFDTRWLVANYEAGDIVLHSPFTVHAATLNESREGVIRLSTDIRYQNVTDEIDARWSNHWSLDDML